MGRTETWLQMIDFFGISFEFRMENYKKFRTKTGGLAFLTFALLSSIYVFFLTYYFFCDPEYYEDENHIRSSNSSIVLLREKFNFALSIPLLKNQTMLPPESLIVKSFHSTKFNDPLEFKKIKEKTRVNIPRIKCSNAVILKDIIIEKDWEEMDSELFCFELNHDINISGNQFNNGSSSIRLELTINKTYFDYYKSALEELQADNTYYVYFLFPFNTFLKDDYSTPIQNLDVIPINLREEDKVMMDVDLRKSEYRLNDNIFDYSENRYSYADLYSYSAYLAKDDSFYQKKLRNCTNFTDPCAKDVDSPKVLSINIRNDIINSVYSRKRYKLFTFFFNKVVTAYRNFFLIFRLIIWYINFKKAKINILKYFFELDFENIESNTLKEKEEYKNLKKTLNELAKKLKKDKMQSNLNNNNNTNSVSVSEIQDSESFPCQQSQNNCSSSQTKSNKLAAFMKLEELNDNRNSMKRSILNFDISNYKNSYDDAFINKNKRSFLKSGFNIHRSFIATENEDKKTIQEKLIEGENAISSNENRGKGINNESSSHETLNTETIKDQDSINKTNESAVNMNINTIRSNFNFIDIDKEIGIKTNIESEKKFTENKLAIRNILKKMFFCRFKGINKMLGYLSKSENLFDQYLDIQYYIKKMNEIEIFKRILLNNNQKILFDFLSYPTFSYSLEKNKTIDLKDIGALKKRKEKYTKEILMEKYELIFNEHENKNKSKMLQSMFEKKISS